MAIVNHKLHFQISRMCRQLIEILFLLIFSAGCVFYHGMRSFVLFILAYFVKRLFPLHYMKPSGDLSVSAHVQQSLETRPNRVSLVVIQEVGAFRE